jgi:hypothetical protein
MNGGKRNAYSHMFFTSALAGVEWSTSRPGRFTPSTRCIGGWVGPRAGLDDVEKRKFLTLPGLELRHLGRPASRYIGYAIPTARTVL